MVTDFHPLSNPENFHLLKANEGKKGGGVAVMISHEPNGSKLLGKCFYDN